MKVDASPEAKAIKKSPIQPFSKSPLATQSDINKLEIAEGLKQLLLSKGCDLNFLLHVEPGLLAQQLGIDEDIAKLIIKAAREMK
jgi:hypothetical protein